MTRDFIVSILDPQFKDFSITGVPKDPKSLLQEIMQSQGWGLPKYHIVEEDGKPHAKRFTAVVSHNERILGEGIGSSKSEAERSAAQAALDKKDT